MLTGGRAFGACVVSLALLVAGCSSGRAQSTSPPTAHNRSASATIEAGRSASVLTAAQLHAHEGLGVPTGWAPVDGGDARLWVPATWTLEYGAGCTNGSGQTNVAYVGLTSLATCHPIGNPALEQAAAFAPPPRTPTGASSQTVNGYRVYAVNTTNPHRTWDVYDVPQLHVRIALRGRLAPRILDTLGPSSRSVALAFADRPPQTRLHTVTAQGISLSIPTAWTVVTPQALGCTSPNDVLELIRPGIGAPGCPVTTGGIVADAVQGDGSGALSTYATASPAVDRPPPSTAILHHGKTTVTVFRDGDGQGSDSLGALIRLAGSRQTHVLNLALSRDGRIDGGILASIRAIT
jgi:hypothetical protein